MEIATFDSATNFSHRLNLLPNFINLKTMQQFKALIKTEIVFWKLRKSCFRIESECLSPKAYLRICITPEGKTLAKTHNSRSSRIRSNKFFCVRWKKALQVRTTSKNCPANTNVQVSQAKTGLLTITFVIIRTTRNQTNFVFFFHLNQTFVAAGFHLEGWFVMPSNFGVILVHVPVEL
jgi:hypothetical protein